MLLISLKGRRPSNGKAELNLCVVGKVGNSGRDHLVQLGMSSAATCGERREQHRLSSTLEIFFDSLFGFHI